MVRLTPVFTRPSAMTQGKGEGVLTRIASIGRHTVSLEKLVYDSVVHKNLCMLSDEAHPLAGLAPPLHWDAVSAPIHCSMPSPGVHPLHTATQLDTKSNANYKDCRLEAKIPRHLNQTPRLWRC